MIILSGCERDADVVNNVPQKPTISTPQTQTVNVPQTRTINDVIVEKDQFTLLEAAVMRSGLSTSLTQGGPFTVFAPTNDAFRSAGFTDLAAINAAPIATLNNILLYHIVSGRNLAPPFNSFNTTVQQTAFTTSVLGNAPLFVTKTNSTSLSVNGSRILDGGAYSFPSNGTIYAVDQVLFPPAANIIQVVQADTSLSLLATVLLRGVAQVTGALSNTATALTVFAPTNAAFREAGFPNAAAINTAPEATLTAVLANHVVANVRAFSPIITGGPVTTFGGVVTATVGTGNSVTLLSRGYRSRASNVLSNIVSGVTLVRNRDINATNGVIHKIDRMLLP